MLYFEPSMRPTPSEILKDPWVSGDKAATTSLPHVLEGVSHLHLQELQKLVLRVMETHVESGLADIDQLFAEIAPDGRIRRASLRERTELELSHSLRQKSTVRAHDLDICFDKLDLFGTGDARDLRCVLCSLRHCSFLTTSLAIRCHLSPRVSSGSPSAKAEHPPQPTETRLRPLRHSKGAPSERSFHGALDPAGCVSLHLLFVSWLRLGTSLRAS